MGRRGLNRTGVTKAYPTPCLVNLPIKQGSLRMTALSFRALASRFDNIIPINLISRTGLLAVEFEIIQRQKIHPNSHVFSTLIILQCYIQK